MRLVLDKIPSRLPDTEQAVESVRTEALDRPDIRLADLSIGQLILELSDGSPTFLTGSNVWLRAVFGRSSDVCRSRRRRCTEHSREIDCLCQERLDYDVVLSSKESVERFIEGSLSILNSRLPKSHRYLRTRNSFANGRIIDPSGANIIDAWSLDPGESIGELLMSYPEAYQRAAIHVGHTVSAASLFRIVRADFDIRCIGRTARSSSYPG